ncbi:MAG: putative bifunctional diguanylate cyclase/phosphodiesterase, partial [Janthinobacterium lividum]
MSLILILDDRASNRTIYGRLARNVEPLVRVEEFADPLAALAWLEGNTPDLIITDFRMPNLDGAEFTRRLRARECTAEIPVIVVTAYDQPGYSTEALDAGATEFLRTPLDYAEFVLRVRNVFRMHRQHKELQRRATNLERELKESEEVREHLVRDSKEALAQVIDTIPAMISAADRDGRCVFSNTFRTSMVGGIGTDGPDPFGIDHAQREASLNGMVFRTGASLPSFEEDLVDHRGRRLVLLTTKAPLRDTTTDEVINVLTTSLDITARKEADERLVYRANHDSQTDLPNRAMLAAKLDQAVARGGRRDMMCAVHFIDLDQFKAINDSLGHLSGDEVLRLVAERVKRCAREQDTVARFGGDEFAVLQTTITGEADAKCLASRIVESLASPFEVNGRQVGVSASVGTALYPRDGSTFTELVTNADLAMYSVKMKGRNGDAIFVPAMTAINGWRLQMRDDLRQALAVDDFHLVYQPQIEITSGRIAGVEALLRWRKPSGEEVAPSVFLPIAEEFGLIAAIDTLV